ncbi:hypothetical protein ABZP36_014167 [Zizania latifolia]
MPLHPTFGRQLIGFRCAREPVEQEARFATAAAPARTSDRFACPSRTVAFPRRGLHRQSPDRTAAKIRLPRQPLACAGHRLFRPTCSLAEAATKMSTELSPPRPCGYSCHQNLELAHIHRLRLPGTGILDGWSPFSELMKRAVGNLRMKTDAKDIKKRIDAEEIA